jgi:hypothetical protein
MRGMRGIGRLLVVAMSAVTLLLVAAVGASAGSRTFGSPRVITAVVHQLVKAEDNGKHTGECHPPKKTHKHGTPGHKNHPCGEDGDDSD